MPIVIETQSLLGPDVPNGTQAIATDGLGNTYIAWKKNNELRLQLSNRDHSVFVAFYTALNAPINIAPSTVSLAAFVSGGAALCYATTGPLGNKIYVAKIKTNGTIDYLSSTNFAVNLDVTYPQIAIATDASDNLAITYISDDDLYVKFIHGITTGATIQGQPFKLNTAEISPQNHAAERSLLSCTSNWTGNMFAALYIRQSDGNGLIRKFSIAGVETPEMNTLHTIRDCPVGGANRGLSCITMQESSEALLFVNPIIPLDLLSPPISFHIKSYRPDLTIDYSKTIQNPGSCTFDLSCLTVAYYQTGNALILMDDGRKKISGFYLDADGLILDEAINLVTTNHAIADSTISGVAKYGDRTTYSYFDNAARLSTLKSTLEQSIRDYGTVPVDIIRPPFIDQNPVDALTTGNSTVILHGTRPNTSLDAFIGTHEIALIGGPQSNISTAQLFTDSGTLNTQFKLELLKTGVEEIHFEDFDTNGAAFDDRNGTTHHAPKIRFSIPSGDYVAARHKIGSIIYDYGIVLRVGTEKSCYMFSGIRDISTLAATKYILADLPNIDGPLEAFSAVLVIATYPDSVGTVFAFENALSLAQATIKFRPLVGVRENSPLL